MPEWDDGASTALHDCRQVLEEHDVLRWLQAVTRAMWRPNAERYEPSQLFDTPRGLAGLAAENLRERLLAEYRSAGSPWRARGVRLTVPHGSLLIEVAELALHVVKAPGVRLGEPEWATFVWDTSLIRHAAAARNNGMDALPPPPIEGQLAFEFDLPVALPSPDYRELFFVWAGDAMGLTAGWLGLPRLGRPRWLAVIPLWRDDGVAVDAGDGVPRPPLGAAFSELEAPRPTVSLKRQPATSAP